MNITRKESFITSFKLSCILNRRIRKENQFLKKLFFYENVMDINFKTTIKLLKRTYKFIVICKRYGS